MTAQCSLRRTKIIIQSQERRFKGRVVCEWQSVRLDLAKEEEEEEKRGIVRGCFVKPCSDISGIVSHALLGRHQERVDVLETFKLRLIDLLNHLLVVRRELDGFVGELCIEVVESKLS